MLMTEGGDFDKLGRGDVWKGQFSLCLHQNHVLPSGLIRPSSIRTTWRRSSAAKLDVLTTQQTHYESLKRGLMQKLLTGEWWVLL